MSDAKKQSLRSKNFMSGVFVLTLSTVIVKIIGVLYKIPMLRLIGSEGMGYFNSAYEIYTLFCVISTAGLPVAMSVMISSTDAQNKNISKRIFKVGLALFLMLGIVGFFAIAGFARPISEFLKSSKAYLCILFISPTVLFVCISSAYRGYFQGKGSMIPTAVSQIIESAGKLVLGIIFAMIALSLGYTAEKVAAFAMMGLVLGMAVSTLYLVLKKLLDDRKNPSVCNMVDNREIFRELLSGAIPITLASAVLSVTKIIDMTMILRRLQFLGYTSAEANSVYGSYTTLALPLFSLAPALVSAVALPIVPAIASARAGGDTEEHKKIIDTALRLTVLLAMPISLGLCVFSGDILSLLFSGEDEAISIASPLLAILGLSVVSSCLITVTNAILQAYKKAYLPIVSMICGAAVKIVIEYFLMGTPSVGIVGAPVSTFLCNLTVAGMNFFFIGKYSPYMPKVMHAFVRPFIYSAGAVGCAYVLKFYVLQRFSHRVLSTVLSIGAAVVIYLIIIISTKEINLLTQRGEGIKADAGLARS